MILRQERMQHMKNDFEMENGCRILRGIGGEVIMLKNEFSSLQIN